MEQWDPLPDTSSPSLSLEPQTPHLAPSPLGLIILEAQGLCHWTSHLSVFTLPPLAVCPLILWTPPPVPWGGGQDPNLPELSFRIYTNRGRGPASAGPWDLLLSGEPQQVGPALVPCPQGPEQHH